MRFAGFQEEECRVFELRKKLGAFFLEKKDQRATKFFDHLWLAKLSYMSCVFEHLNKLNISLQGKDSNVFKSTGKVDALKLKILLWKKRVKSQNFSDFPMLDNFIDEREEGFAVSVMTDLVPLILAHWELLQENFENYVSKEQSYYLEGNTCNHLSIHPRKMKTCLISVQISPRKFCLKAHHMPTLGCNFGMFLNIKN